MFGFKTKKQRVIDEFKAIFSSVIKQGPRSEEWLFALSEEDKMYYAQMAMAGAETNNILKSNIDKNKKQDSLTEHIKREKLLLLEVLDKAVDPVVIELAFERGEELIAIQSKMRIRELADTAGKILKEYLAVHAALVKDRRIDFNETEAVKRRLFDLQDKIENLRKELKTFPPDQEKY